MNLHLGCGPRNFGKDWIHIDGKHYPHVASNKVFPLPFEANSADLIYASHLLQYFNKLDAATVLANWKKVLKPCGILRLAVPDVEAMATLYIEKGLPLQMFLGPLYGQMSMNGEYIYHKIAYDYPRLKMVLEGLGYKNVKRYNWRETEHAEHDDHSQAYIPHMDKENGSLISLNVEATK